eukprot:jgi/Tetstr1/454041/TSEL_040960.t1
MEYTSITEAYVRDGSVPGANPVGGSPAASPLSPPAMQKNADIVSILPSMGSTPLPPHTQPETFVTNALRAQQASAAHGPYTPTPPAYIDAAQLEPPEAHGEPGYFERLGMRRRDVMKLVVCAVMITLGLSLHWVGNHYVTEWIESSDFDGKQRLAIRLAYPAAVVFVMWNLKAFQ